MVVVVSCARSGSIAAAISATSDGASIERKASRISSATVRKRCWHAAVRSWRSSGELAPQSDVDAVAADRAGRQ